MADNVEISNVGGQGVASEVTLARLTASIEALARRTGLNPASEAARLQRLHNDAITSGVTVVRDSTEALEENVDAVQDATAATTRMSTSMNGLAGTALGALWRSASELTTMLFQGGSSVSDFTAALPMVGTMLGPLADYVDESIESFRDLSASGASFGNSITNMRNTATGLGLSLGEMTELFTQNAVQLASLGGTVAEGAARFKEMNKNIKATGDFEQLKQMGFTVMEINEGMADYVDLQARMGTLQGRSTKSLADGSANYLLQIDKLAKITGKTRKEAEADLAAQAADAGIRGLANALESTPELYDNFQLSLGMMKNLGPDVENVFHDLLDGVPDTPEAAKFGAMLGKAAPAVFDALQKVAKGADPKILQTALLASKDALDEFATAGGQRSATETKRYIDNLRMQDSIFGALQDQKLNMKIMGEKELDIAKAEQAKRNDTTASLTTFDDSMRAVGASLQSAFISTGVLDLVSSGLLKVSQMLTALVVPLTSFTNAVTNDGWLTAITDTLKDDLKSLFTGESVIGAVAAGIGVLFASKAIAGALLRSVTGSFSNVFSGIMSSLPGSDTNNARNTSNNSNTRNSRRQRPSRGPAAGAGAGGAIGNFVGSMGAGIMQGAAAGLTAFANPAVLKGAVILAGVIVAVGGAVAVASWMLGTALPTFVSGLKKFEDVNGGALVDAAAGMIAISGAMAVFGVGTAVAGLGALVGELGSGIVALFDGDGPIAKLEKFSAANIDGAKVKSNAEAMVAFSEAMVKGGDASAVAGISSFVGAVSSSLTKFIGADSPLDQLAEFGKAKINAAGVINNANAMVAFSEAMSSSSINSANSEFEIPRQLVFRLHELGKINGKNITSTAAGLQSLAGVTGLKTNLAILNAGLDTDKIKNYTKAMDKLVDKLEDLNKVLAEDNKGLFGGGTGTSAANVVRQPAAIAATSDSAGRPEMLNKLMSEILSVLKDISEDTGKTEKHTKNLGSSNNIARGYVSNTSR